mgnify:FL=1
MKFQNYFADFVTQKNEENIAYKWRNLYPAKKIRKSKTVVKTARGNRKGGKKNDKK